MCLLTENIVDGMALFHLTNGDLNVMFPGKVGIARKLTVFVESLKSNSDVSAQIQTQIQSQVNFSNGAVPSAAVSVSSANTVNSVTDSHPAPSCSQRSECMSLPAYSTRIKDVLDKGNILLDFDLFVEETVYHVISNGDMKTKDQYEEFGRRLLTAYPCLDFPGKKTSWVIEGSKGFCCQNAIFCSSKIPNFVKILPKSGTLPVFRHSKMRPF